MLYDILYLWINEMERSLGSLLWSSLEALKATYNVSSDDQDSRRDDLSVSLITTILTWGSRSLFVINTVTSDTPLKIHELNVNDKNIANKNNLLEESGGNETDSTCMLHFAIQWNWVYFTMTY